MPVTSRTSTQIWHLALLDLRKKYIQTRLGFFWAIVQPTTMFLIFWLISVYGLKLNIGDDEAPFFALLFCGLLPWMTLSASITNACSALPTHLHLLIDRTISPVAIIVSSTLSAVLMHGPLLLIVAVILIISGIEFTLTWLAVAYYAICLSALSLGISFIVAPLTARAPDIVEAVTTFLLIWFWGSPIIWSLSLVPEALSAYFRLNPLVYVIEGYRGALLYDNPWPSTLSFSAVFWIEVVLAFVIGITLIKLADRKLIEWLRR